MIIDFSLHFTLKGQTLREIFDKMFSGTELDIINESDTTVLHHCFLPRNEVIEKGFTTDVVDFLDGQADQIVNWKNANESLDLSRLLMLQNLKRLNGIAFFIGVIKDGVLEEYNLAKSIGVRIIHIT